MKSGIEFNISFRNEPSIQSGDLHMMHGLYEMGFYGLREAAHHGVTCPNDMVDGTRYIKSFVNGKKNNDLKRFLWSLVLTRICRTWAWTAQAAKYISTHQAQKKGSKFGKQPIYRGKPWRKKHKNSRAYRWIGKPYIRSPFRRKCTWCFRCWNGSFACRYK